MPAVAVEASIKAVAAVDVYGVEQIAGSAPETIHPSAFVTNLAGGGAVVNEANAYDLSLSTYAKITSATGQSAAITYSGFAADAAPAGRSTVTIRVNLAVILMDADDFVTVWFKARTADPLVQVASYSSADVNSSAVWKEVDVTAAAGSFPSDQFAVAVVHRNALSNPPGPT